MPIIKAGPFKILQTEADHFVYVVTPEGNSIRIERFDAEELMNGLKKIFGLSDKLFHDPKLPTCPNCEKGSIINTPVDSYCINCS